MNGLDHTSVHPSSDGLLPAIGESPRVLILGSFPSRMSLRQAEYYGNPRNQFWKILEAVFTIDPSRPYRERIDQVTARHIALWDVVGTCERPGSADARITRPAFNDIAALVQVHPSLRLIALNGSTAGRFYGKIAGRICIPHVILPSSSPANAGMTLEEKIRKWSVLKQAL